MTTDASALALSARVGRAFFGSRSSLRPAQIRAMAPILSGHDALILAGTGSGKTEAAVAPLVDRFYQDAYQASGSTWLYMSPTRALANDIFERLTGPMESLQFKVGLQHGERKSLHLKERPQLLITTPESLDILVTSGHEALRSVKGVVIDEAHQLAGSQRGLQLAIVLHRLELLVERAVQTVGMSATVSDPGGLWSVLRPGRSVSVIEEPSTRPRRFLLRRETNEAAVQVLTQKLAGADKVLVFTKSRQQADRYASLLGEQTAFGRRVYVHHSAVGRGERERIERQFKEPERAICFATTTLELGIDIGDVNLVVLAEPAADWKSFLQRIGRGNRRSDGPVESLLLVGPDSRAPVLDAALHLSLCRLVDHATILSEAPARAYGAIAQQAAHVVERGSTWTHRRTLAGTLAMGAGVSEEIVERIIEELITREVLQTHPVLNQLGAGPNLEALERQGALWSNFPDSSSALPMFHGDRRIGEMQLFNLSAIAPGTTIGFQGRTWAVERVLPREVRVRPAAGPPAMFLKFQSSAAGDDALTVDGMLDILGSPPASVTINGGSAEWWGRVSAGMRERGRDCLPFWRRDDGSCALATFAGKVVNTAILNWLGVGGVAESAVLVVDELPDLHDLPSAQGLRSEAYRALSRPRDLTPWQQLLPAELLYEELVGEWERRPIYAAILDRLRNARPDKVPDDRYECLIPRK